MTQLKISEQTAPVAMSRRPRVGFLGVGWIGRSRLEAIAEADVVEIVAVADTDATARAAAGSAVPASAVCGSLEELLASGVDAVVIATPSAGHAEEATMALEDGKAVFCQKPLGRSGPETRRVIASARRADRLLDVDFSYRNTEGLEHIRRMIAAGELGRIFSVELVFHNAYGPDKPWYYDQARSGGGCLADLGVHLADIALWCLGHPKVFDVSGRLFRNGQALPPGSPEAEDFVIADMRLGSGICVSLSCSWRSHAGQDAAIMARFHGTEGGATWQNVDGSFFDFLTTKCVGTQRHVVAQPSGGWFGRRAALWAARLAEDAGFDPEVERFADVAEVIDRIYGRV